MVDPQLAGSPWRSDIAPKARRSRRARPPPGFGWVVGGAVFVAAVIVPLWRQQGTRSWQALMAEDGTTYAEQAIRHGGLNVLLRGYAGYVQLPPRLVALGAPLVPVRGLALYFAVAGTAIAAVLGLFVYWATAGWIDGWPMRLVLASFVVIMPVLGGENTANGVNTIWVFASVAPWALISWREAPRATALRALFAFLAALSTPVCIIFVPLAVGWAVVRRTRSALVVAAVFGLGLVLQGVAVLTAGDTATPRDPNSVGQLTQALGSHVYGIFLLGMKGVDAWGGLHSPGIYLGGPLVVTALFVLFLWGAPRRSQAMAAAFMGLAVVSWVLPVWGRGSGVLADTSNYIDPLKYGSALRYSVLPIVMVASSITLLVAAPGRRRHRTLARVGAVVFAVQVCLLAGLGFTVHNYKSSELQWRRSIDSAYHAVCHDRPSARPVTVLTSIFRTYSVHLECKDLEP